MVPPRPMPAPRGRRRFAIATAIALVAAASGGSAAVWRAFGAERAHARRRVADRSVILGTRFGDLEYAIAGDGSPVLMVHGTGGGFDQGLAFVDRLAGRGYRFIAPSRFGYLRSAFPAEPSSENQADAFVDLLDHLGIARVPIVGGSAGALSASQFALRHPDRCSGLVLLVPAANVRDRDPVGMGPATERLVRALLSSDFLYWSATKLARAQLVRTLLATDPALLLRVSDDEQRRANRILEDIMPIRERSRGMMNDAKLAGHPARMDFSRVRVPTLVLSVEDDRFGTATTARDIAAAVPGAQLKIYSSGGHVWLGHDADVSDEIDRFLQGLPQPAQGAYPLRKVAVSGHSTDC